MRTILIIFFLSIIVIYALLCYQSEYADYLKMAQETTNEVFYVKTTKLSQGEIDAITDVLQGKGYMITQISDCFIKFQQH